jgi:hypothetical protein
MTATDRFDWQSFLWFVIFHVAILVAAVLLSLLVRTSEVHAEGWFNPGVDGGGGGIGEHDLDGRRLYGNKADDPNTYCWHAAADTWRCVAGGTDVVDITSAGIKVPDDIPLCLGDDDDFCIEHDTDGSPDGLRLTQKDCDGSPCDPMEFYKSGGANVIAMRASSVTNPDAKMTFGPPAASGYSLGANDSHFTGDKFEVDGNAKFDNTINVSGSNSIYMGLTRIYSLSAGYLSYENGAAQASPVIFQTGATSGTSQTASFEIKTGAQTNVGDYDSGDNNRYTGDTTTDGDTGDCNTWTGVAGAGTADAGDINMSVNGAPGVGTDVFQALGATGAVDLLKIKQEDASATCTLGQWVIDTGGGTVELCYCQATDTWYCTPLTAGPTD